jgi:heme O synthase-like polyprenyltransferase
MLGWVATGNFRSWDFIFNSVLWQFPHFGQLDGFYEDYERQVFMLPTGKKR